MKRSSILLLLGLACIASMAFADSKKIYCDKKRPDPSKCFGQGATYEPTCGYYEKDCPLGVCGKQVSNGCDACSDPNVIYYTKQECKPEEVVQTCSKDICNLEVDPEQDKVFEPVCGFRKGCTKGDCTETFDNICQACKNSKYPWYQVGVCQDDRKSCTDKKTVNKASKSQEVCAFFDTVDGGVNQHTTVTNARDACADPAVKFYINEECGGGSRGDSTYCLPNNRNGFCTKEYNPVCGFYLDKNGVMQHKVMGNACTACADSSVIYHQPGPCVFKCNRNPFIIFECDGTTIDPVCGSYKENGRTKQISLKNACIGCYNIPTKIDTYTDGLCPGDEGISCDLYRSRPRNNTSILNDLIYQNVCGYTRKGCTSRSCRRTYADQYEACARNSVEFFTDGPC